MLAVDWVAPLKLLSATPRMKILLRPAPSAVLCNTGTDCAALSRSGVTVMPPGPARPVTVVNVPG